MSCCPPMCCPPTCCPPIMIRTKAPRQPSQMVNFTVPATNVCCEVPPAPRPRCPPKMVNLPIMICEEEEECCGPARRCPPIRCPPVRCGTSCRPIRCQTSCPPIQCSTPCGPIQCAIACPTSCSPCCDPCCSPCPGSSYGFPLPCQRRTRREKRWPMCNFLKPCIDTRIYRNGEHMSISYAGHIPGEQYIHGRNLPTTTTFAKRRLCTFTPYEFVDPDGCCSFP